MDAQEYYKTCLEQASAVVKQVRADQLANETPDDEWTVRDLTSHMHNEVAWVPDILAGKTVADVGTKYDGDVFHDDAIDGGIDLATAWENAAVKAEQAAEDCDPDATAHLSYTDTTNADYLQMTGGDILVHAWDLAKAIGVPLSFNQEVAEHMWSRVKDRDLSASGLFKESLPAAADASVEDKILAHFGRDVTWRANA